MNTPTPELSVIIPVLHDTGELCGLLSSLAGQTGTTFEVIVCDGDSGDRSHSLAHAWQDTGPFPLKTVSSPPGRGIQMNAGAAIAAGSILLFLHADSRFDRPDALAAAVQTYRHTRRLSPLPLAARFRLDFRRGSNDAQLRYLFLETKARLDRVECIRGDQGIMIEPALFHQLGCFDPSLPYLEDVRFAALVAGAGSWLLLPAAVSTSTRRFEQEGYGTRQLLNAVIINAFHTGWTGLLETLPELYRDSRHGGKIQLYPLLAGIRAALSGCDRSWRRNFWRETGRHAVANAWQLCLLADVRSGRRAGLDADTIPLRRLKHYAPRLEELQGSRGAALLASLLLRLLFAAAVSGAWAVWRFCPERLTGTRQKGRSPAP